MKKIWQALFITFFLIGCAAKVSDIPKGYISKNEYFSSNFQDYTDYAKYVYKENVVINNNEYKIISNTEIDDIKEYFVNFEDIMISQEREIEYDFDINLITEGDYVKIKTKEGKEIGNSKYGKFDDYSVYFFDAETLTLYYIHNNI